MQEPTREVWRGIPGHEDKYEVSNLGRIRGLPRFVQRGNHKLFVRGRIIRTPAKSNGYLHFKLANGDESTYPTVHQCVAAAFLGPCPPGHEINHKDGDKTNNRPSNLEYVTAKANIQHAFRRGLQRIGESSPHARLTEDDVRAIRAARGKLTAKELAKRYGVSHEYIPLIWRHRRWKHLK